MDPILDAGPAQVRPEVEGKWHDGSQCNNISRSFKEC